MKLTQILLLVILGWTMMGLGWVINEQHKIDSIQTK